MPLNHVRKLFFLHTRNPAGPVAVADIPVPAYARDRPIVRTAIRHESRPAIYPLARTCVFGCRLGVVLRAYQGRRAVGRADLDAGGKNIHRSGDSCRRPESTRRKATARPAQLGLAFWPRSNWHDAAVLSGVMGNPACVIEPGRYPHDDQSANGPGTDSAISS